MRYGCMKKYFAIALTVLGLAAFTTQPAKAGVSFGVSVSSPGYYYYPGYYYSDYYYGPGYYYGPRYYHYWYYHPWRHRHWHHNWHYGY